MRFSTRYQRYQGKGETEGPYPYGADLQWDDLLLYFIVAVWPSWLLKAFPLIPGYTAG